MSENNPIHDVQSLMAALSITPALPAAPAAPDLSGEDALQTPQDAPPELDLLRTKQRFALEDLLAGKTHAEAAQSAGVDRRTIHRWLTQDPAFRCAIDACHQRTIRTAEDQLTQATQAAAYVLSQAAARDYRAAAVLLRGRGLLGKRGKFQPEAQPINPAVELPLPSVPPARLRDFEIRLRELILSFKEEPKVMERIEDKAGDVTADSATGTQ